MGDNSNIVLSGFYSPQIALLNDTECDTSAQTAAELFAFEHRPRDIWGDFNQHVYRYANSLEGWRFFITLKHH